jgi:hypothetical protein
MMLAIEREEGRAAVLEDRQTAVPYRRRMTDEGSRAALIRRRRGLPVSARPLAGRQLSTGKVAAAQPRMGAALARRRPVLV